MCHMICKYKQLFYVIMEVFKFGFVLCVLLHFITTSLAGKARHVSVDLSMILKVIEKLY